MGLETYLRETKMDRHRLGDVEDLAVLTDDKDEPVQRLQQHTPTVTHALFSSPPLCTSFLPLFSPQFAFFLPPFLPSSFLPPSDNGADSVPSNIAP